MARDPSPPRESQYPLVSMDDAISTIISSLKTLPSETAAPGRALLRRVLAADVTSPRPLPPFRASIKDGYAVRAADGNAGPLVEIAGSLAGANRSTPAVGPGQCAYVTTGAPMPDGADAVLMVEYSKRVKRVDGGGGMVEFSEWVSGAGVDVRAVGSDVAEGETVLRKGDVVGSAELGILIGCGVRSVEVVRRVRIGVMSTGDEVVDADEDAAAAGGLGAGKIVDSNRPMLLAAVEETLPFCDAVDLGIVRDEYSAVKRAIVDGLAECDVVLTSGGVSMGTRDLVKPVLEEVGTVHFGRVRMKPGKPLTYATADGRNVCAIGLPGNPVSAFVCFHLAVSAAAKTLAGWSADKAAGTIVDVTVDHEFKLDTQRPEFHRVTLSVRLARQCPLFHHHQHRHQHHQQRWQGGVFRACPKSTGE
jgi:gephyrin